jgi:hypothetical protein
MQILPHFRFQETRRLVKPAELVLVPEIDVLIATSMWLWRKQCSHFRFSVARGHGIDASADKARLLKTLNSAGVPSTECSFVPVGPDIQAISQTRFWQVECKGAGRGKPTTQRNNFDRAIASVVSYYTEQPPRGFGTAQPVLGLALPATDL